MKKKESCNRAPFMVPTISEWKMSRDGWTPSSIISSYASLNRKCLLPPQQQNPINPLRIELEREKRKQNPSDFFIEQWDWRKTCAEQLEKKQRLCTRKHCWHSSSWRTLLLKLQSIDAQVLEAAVNSAALWMIHEIVSVEIKICKWGCWKIEEYQQRSEAASSWLVTIW